MGGALRIDGSEFPLVRMILPADSDPADVPALYRAYDVQLARGRQALLVDMRALNPLFAGPLGRKAVLHEVHAREDVFARVLVAEARVVSGSLVRGIVTAFEWMRRVSGTYPMRVFESEQQAVAWLRESLEADGKTEPAP